jgi:hypothetical protein
MLTAYPVIPGDPVQWFDTPGGLPIFTGTSFNTPYLTADAVYYVTALSGCPGSSQPVAATIFTAPSLSLGSDSVILASGQSLSLDAGAGFESYIWNTGDTTSAILVSAAGTYTVVATDMNGCTATDEVVILLNTSIATNELLPIQVYPNPARGHVTVRIPSDHQGRLRMSLFSADGKLVQREEIKASAGFEHRIDLQGLASGIYYLETVGAEYASKSKIVIQ